MLCYLFAGVQYSAVVETLYDKRQKALRSYIGIDCSIISSVLKHAHSYMVMTQKKINYYLLLLCLIIVYYVIMLPYYYYCVYLFVVYKYFICYHMNKKSKLLFFYVFSF